MIFYYCIGIVILFCLIYVLTRKQKCEYRFSAGKYCTKQATKFHLPEQSYSCDEHSEYFRQLNDKVIDL
jgi:hypothetical protein